MHPENPVAKKDRKPERGNADGTSLRWRGMRNNRAAYRGHSDFAAKDDIDLGDKPGIRCDFYHSPTKSGLLSGREIITAPSFFLPTGAMVNTPCARIGQPKLTSCFRTAEIERCVKAMQQLTRYRTAEKVPEPPCNRGSGPRFGCTIGLRPVRDEEAFRDQPMRKRR
jgi:hypothetical protein